MRKGGESETMNNSILFVLCSSHPFICLRLSPLLTEGLLLAAGLIDAAAPDVTHPFDDIMIAVVELRLKDLQVAHFQSRWSKRYLEIERIPH